MHVPNDPVRMHGEHGWVEPAGAEYGYGPLPEVGHVGGPWHGLHGQLRPLDAS